MKSAVVIAAALAGYLAYLALHTAEYVVWLDTAPSEAIALGWRP